MVRTFRLISILLLAGLMLAACAPAATPAPTAIPTLPPVPTAAPTTPPAPANPELILATTTSTRDTGLLDKLLPMFQKASGYTVKMVAVGSGAALTLGQEGNADVLLVHSPAAEVDLMTKGFGKERMLVMHNDFVVVGPAADPAKIKGSATAVEAFKKIAEAKAIFATRGDKSGTNTAELNIWKAAAITPAGDWYLNTGQGMADTLRIISEKGGYTLADRGTYLAQKKTLQLDILVEGDKALLNIYHVITVNPDKWPKVNYAGAKAFADYILSADVQKFIGTFGVDLYGSPLFFPDAGKPE
jgi:tungstate transport system substrate-binding protein